MLRRRSKPNVLCLFASHSCDLLSVLLAKEYTYLLSESETCFIAHRRITSVLLSAVFSYTLQLILRLAFYVSSQSWPVIC